MVDDVHDRIHRRWLEHAEPIPREESVAQLLAAQGSATIRQQQFSRRTPVPVHLGSGENPFRRSVSQCRHREFGVAVVKHHHAVVNGG